LFIIIVRFIPNALRFFFQNFPFFGPKTPYNPTTHKLSPPLVTPNQVSYSKIRCSSCSPPLSSSRIPPTMAQTKCLTVGALPFAPDPPTTKIMRGLVYPRFFLFPFPSLPGPSNTIFSDRLSPFLFCPFPPTLLCPGSGKTFSRHPRLFIPLGRGLSFW